jgi:2-phospho-L-lactate transferase/gluconeogenesis factor (CofD/UPF0052 family)
VKEVQEDMLQEEMHGEGLTDISDEYNEMSEEEEMQAMEELEELRKDVKKKLLH